MTETVSEPVLCAVAGCDRGSACRGWCRPHYQRWYRHGDPLKGERTRRRRDPECSVDGCGVSMVARGMCRLHYERAVRGAVVDGSQTATTCGDRKCAVDECERAMRTRGYCPPHYTRWLRTGDPLGSVPRKPRVNGTGAGWVNPHGYRMLHRPGHPNASPNHRVPEHVVVMSDLLGRGLLPNENVHHRNGQRADNRPENLELWVVPQPAGQRVSDLVEFGNWIRATYGEDPSVYRAAITDAGVLAHTSARSVCRQSTTERLTAESATT